jgi:uncharacterized protein (TIGR02001 family)
VRWIAATLLINVSAFASAPASAQVSATASVKSDERFRGRSLSEGHPAATLDVSYDRHDGSYFGGSATLVLGGDDDVGLLGTQAYVGYATRTENGLSIDAGIVGYAYTRRYSGRREERYAEAHVGVSNETVSASARYTPSYLGLGTSVVYTEIGTTKRVARDWVLHAHAGVLVQTSGMPALGGRRVRYDGRLSLRRDFGSYALEAAWTIGGPNDQYFDGPWQGASALVFSVQRGF